MKLLINIPIYHLRPLYFDSAKTFGSGDNSREISTIRTCGQLINDIYESIVFHRRINSEIRTCDSLYTDADRLIKKGLRLTKPRLFVPC